MMDFIKINYTDKNYPLPTDKTDFAISVNNETGETDGKKTGNYFGMEIIKYQSERILIKGSLHKFFNRTDFNGNDFDFINLHSIISDLEKEIGLLPHHCKLENVEIGVNVELPFNPNRVLKNLLFHRTKAFSSPIPNSYYYQSKKDEYIIKIYNKTAQYQGVKTEIENKLTQTIKDDERQRLEFQMKVIKEQLKPNTMRFEIKYTKMRYLNKIGVVYLSDLINPNLFIKFKDLLLKEFREVCFYDITTDESKMTKGEQIKIKDYRNPNYWQNLNNKNKYHHKNKFEEITRKYSQNTKVEKTVKLTTQIRSKLTTSFGVN